MRTRFDGYEVDREALELSRGGHVVPLAPMAVRVLLHLADNAGRLVSRDELYQRLWPEGGVDRERLLNTYVRQIRGALGERAGDDVYLRTYPRRGYRFLPEVSLSDDAGAARPAIEPIGRASRVAWGVGIAGAAAFVLLAGGSALRAPAAAPLPAGEGAATAFQMGVELLEQPDPAARASAVPYFREVLQEQPEFGPALSGLAEGLFWAGDPASAEQAGRRALVGSPDDPRAHLVVGASVLSARWAWAEAEAHLRRAVDADPSDANPRVALSFLLVSAGRGAEAQEVLDAAVALEPTSAVVTGDLGMMYGWLGRHEEALDLCRRTIVVEPAATWGHECALEAARALGDDVEVQERAASLLRSAGATPSEVLGSSRGVDQPVQELRRYQLERSLHSSDFQRAVAWVEVGEADRALDALESAAQKREGGVVALAAHPLLRSLSGRPRYERLREAVLGDAS